jgi:hypothetical protein
VVLILTSWIAHDRPAFAPVQFVDAHSFPVTGTRFAKHVQAQLPFCVRRYVPLIVEPAVMFIDRPVAGHDTHPGQSVIPEKVT